MRIGKKAGMVNMETFTDGHPLLVRVTIGGVEAQVGVEDLHDLRYCADRMIKQVDEHEARRRR